MTSSANVQFSIIALRFVSKWPYFRVWLASAGTADMLLLTWAHLPLLVLGSKETFFSALFGCRDSGYKSKNTNSDPQEGFAIHCSTSWVFCRAFLIHKAAACKWAKTSPKSWRSKRHQHSSCGMSLLGLWAVRCVWHQQTWLKTLKRISVAYFDLVRVGKSAHVLFKLNFICHNSQSHKLKIFSLMTQTLTSDDSIILCATSMRCLFLFSSGLKSKWSFNKILERKCPHV